MTDKLSDPRRILEDTDWCDLEHGSGSAFPETPIKLSGLVSGDLYAVDIALNHLSDDLLHQGSLYSATAPAARYVAALLGDPRSWESLSPDWEKGKYPLRGKLLGWLASVADAVSNSMERKIWVWAETSAMECLLFREVREIRPIVFLGVVGCVNDPDIRVREPALVAAVRLLESPELASCREMLVSSVRNVLAVSSEEWRRRMAIEALAAWGEDVDSLRGAMEPAIVDNDFWNDVSVGGAESINEPPF